MKKNIKLSFIMAFLITITAVIHQRKTGPTYPKKIDVEIENKIYNLKFIRSFGGDGDAEINLEIPNKNVIGNIFYKKYPSNKGENFKKIDFLREKNFLKAKLPHQKPAGKLIYFVVLKSENKEFSLLKDEPAIIRFKGEVPALILIPHILFMFLAIFLSNLSGMLAFFKNDDFKKYSILTVVFLFIGGIILGPVVQKYAFDEFWTGIPFGWDLTDNKTLLSFVFWLIALIFNFKNKRRVIVIIASVILLLVYSIPHSLYGSELNHETGEVIQG